MDKLKKLFHTRRAKHGSYSAFLTVIVTAIIIVVNLIIGQLPENVRNIDVSSNRIYEISNVTTDLLGKLDHKVTFTVLADQSSTDNRITTFISKYAALSKKISVEWIDPVLHPSALKKYDVDADTIVIGCADTEKTMNVSFSDILITDQAMAYYYGSSEPTDFDGEGQLTSAVNYVTSNVSKRIYYTSGHGETTFSASAFDLLEKSNYKTAELNLFQTGSIPDDCDLLIFNAPAKDLSDDEATVVKNYLAAGGKMLVLLGDTDKSTTPNFAAILKEYGFDQADGYIADSKNNYQGNPYYIIPTLSLEGDMAKGMSSKTTLIINARGFSQTEPARDTIEMNSFMTTSDSGYAVTNNNDAVQGNYILGGIATETTENGTARLTVFSTESLIDSQITDYFTTLENMNLFMNAVSSNFDDVSNLSIEKKTLSTEYNTMKHAGVISLFLIFGIPMIVLISGFVVWFKRRKA